MIDIQSETLLSFSEAAKVLPGRPHISTLHRWRLRGVRGNKLETCLVGGKRFTSREALQRFTDNITAASEGEPCQILRNKKSEREIQRAEAELEIDGI